MDRSRVIGIALVVVSACAFGSGPLFAQPVYAAGVSWLTLLAWRFLFGASLAWLVLLLTPQGRSGLRTLLGRPRTLAAAFGLGVIYTGNAGTYYAALETMDVSLAAIIVYVYPPIVAVLARWFGAPLQGWRAWVALGIAVLGVVLTLGGIDPSADAPPSGIVLSLASAAIYAVWIILSARMQGERSGRIAGADEGTVALASTAVVMTATMLVFWLGALATGSPVLPAEVPASAWPGLVGVGVVATFVAIVTFYAATRRIGAAQAALISTIEPLWTVGLATFLLGERLTPVQLLGGAMILAAVVLSQTRGRGDADEALPHPTVRLADE